MSALLRTAITGASAATMTAPGRRPGRPALRIRERTQAWFVARLKLQDTQTLTQRNVYILPTRAGWAFCATLGVMLLAAINYQLNLGYALTFLLGGAALASMHQTHGNLRGLTLQLKTPQPVFAGEPATIEIVVTSPGRARTGVGLGLVGQRRMGMAWVDVPAHGSAAARLRFVPPARGHHPLPTLMADTHFPLGLFRAWTIWRPASEVLVYPAPERPAPPLPAAGASNGADRPLRNGAGSEFDGVRAWRRGDTLRRVVWKKFAKSGELVSRDTQASSAHVLWLEYAAAGAADAESRLRRLAAWVLAAHASGLSFGLRLPGRELAAAGGETQRRLALEMLALWPQSGPARPTTDA